MLAVREHLKAALPSVVKTGNNYTVPTILTSRHSSNGITNGAKL